MQNKLQGFYFMGKEITSFHRNILRKKGYKLQIYEIYLLELVRLVYQKISPNCTYLLVRIPFFILSWKLLSDKNDFEYRTFVKDITE